MEHVFRYFLLRLVLERKVTFTLLIWIEKEGFCERAYLGCCTSHALFKLALPWVIGSMDIDPLKQYDVHFGNNDVPQLALRISRSSES